MDSQLLSRYENYSSDTKYVLLPFGYRKSESAKDKMRQNLIWQRKKCISYFKLHSVVSPFAVQHVQ